jgi:hypothetical protein
MSAHPSSHFRRALALSAALVGLAAGPSAHALVFITSGDTAFNSTAPGGALTDSGWQFQGDWGGLLGTPVGPNFFLTAKHGGGSVGDGFNYAGNTFTTTAQFDHPTADLTLWRVGGTFSSYAPLYTGTDEVGKSLVLFGRGAVRGAEVNVAGASPTDLRGWRWGDTGGGVRRWGENAVDTVATVGGANYLVAGFSADGGVNEATLSGGDSGGGVFIQDGGIWKLAGINYAVQAEFRSAADGPSFFGAIFDAGGLYGNTTSGFQLLGDGPGNVEASFYSTRVSSYVVWIEGTMAVPEPAEIGAFAAVALAGFGVFRRVRAAR